MGILDSFLNYFSTVQTNQANQQLTRLAWERDDNAVQRRAADLQAAGLNPVLAAGSAATSQAPIPARQASLEGFDAALGVGKTERSHIAMTEAQAELIKNQSESVAADARIKNIEADRQEALAGYQPGQKKAGPIDADLVLQAMMVEAKNRNIKATTETQQQEFLSKHQQEFNELSLKARREEWTQSQLKREIQSLTRDLLQKDKDWYTANRVIGAARNITGMMAGWQ